MKGVSLIRQMSSVVSFKETCKWLLLKSRQNEQILQLLENVRSAVWTLYIHSFRVASFSKIYEIQSITLMYFLCWIVGESPPRAFFCYKKVIKQHPRHLWHLNDLLDPLRILQDLSLYLSSKSIREEKQENSQKFPSLSSTNFASQSG